MGQCCTDFSTSVSRFENSNISSDIDERINNEICDAEIMKKSPQRVIIYSINNNNRPKLMYQLLKFHIIQDTTPVFNYYQNYFKSVLWTTTVLMGRYLEITLNPNELGDILNYLVKMPSTINSENIQFDNDQINAIMNIWSYKYSLYFFSKLINNIHQGVIHCNSSAENSSRNEAAIIKESYSSFGGDAPGFIESKEDGSVNRSGCVNTTRSVNSPSHKLKKYDQINGSSADTTRSVNMPNTPVNTSKTNNDFKLIISKTKLDFSNIHDDEFQKSISRIREEYIDKEMIDFFTGQSGYDLISIIKRKEDIMNNIIPSINDIIDYHASINDEKEFEINIDNTKYVFIGA